MGALLRHCQPREYPVADVETDAALLARVRHDRQAFATLYDRYFDAIYRYAFVKLRGAERAEDATHQVFVRALEALPRYQEAGRFRSWLFTIAHNVVTTELGRWSPGTLVAESDQLVDPAAGPEADALAAVERRALRTALDRLPADQRQAVDLRLAGLTGREIAVEMGRSHEAVKMLQHRALARLRAELATTNQVNGRHDA